MRFALTDDRALCTFSDMANTSDIDVKALRAAKGWTQDQMAEYLGLDRSSVSRIENGSEISGPVRRLLELLQAESAAQAVA